MATYSKTQLSVRSLSREYLDGLLQLTFDLLDKEKVNLNFDERLKVAIALLKTLYQDFKLTLTKVGKTVEPQSSLSELDRQRDMDIIDFRYYIRSQLRHRQEKRRQAAQELNAFLGQFGDMRTKSQAEQTVAVRDLLKGLEDKDIRAKLTLIGAGDYYANLKESQAKFEEAYLQKTKKRQQGQTNQADQARLALLKHYREIYGYLLALEYFDKDGPHRPVLAAFNAARLTYQDEVKRKSNQAKKKAAEKEQAVSISQVEGEGEN